MCVTHTTKINQEEIRTGKLVNQSGKESSRLLEYTTLLIPMSLRDLERKNTWLTKSILICEVRNRKENSKERGKNLNLQHSRHSLSITHERFELWDEVIHPLPGSACHRCTSSAVAATPVFVLISTSTCHSGRELAVAAVASLQS